ncbi:hypothetical protein D3C75_516510 [compost metagenome]
MQIKFTVIKNEDAEKHLDEPEKVELLRLLNKVRSGRVSEGKVALNTYLVVNTDEAYVGEVVSILKDHGHWDPVPDPNQAEMRYEGNVLLLPGTEVEA